MVPFAFQLSVFKLVKKETASTYKFVHMENVSFPSAHTLDISHSGISSSGELGHSCVLHTSSEIAKIVTVAVLKENF